MAHHIVNFEPHNPSNGQSEIDVEAAAHVSQGHDLFWPDRFQRSATSGQRDGPRRADTPHPENSLPRPTTQDSWLEDFFDVDRWLKDDGSFPETLKGNVDLPVQDENLACRLSSYGEANITDEQDFSNLPRWIRGSYMPETPCASCRYHRLQCLIIRTGDGNPNPILSCASCVALFRECSFAPGEKRQPSNFEIPYITSGHLHGVAEEDSGQEVDLNSPLGEEGDQDSKLAAVDTAGASSHPLLRSGSIPRNHKSQKASRKVLENWFLAHQNDPYPTEEEKSQLELESGLSRVQVRDWFANARRRRQIRQHALPISTSRFGSDQDLSSLTPMQRWRNSPPEHDSIPPSFLATVSSSTHIVQDIASEGPMTGENFDTGAKANSISSIDSGQSTNSNSSASSAWSNLSHLSAQRLKRARRKTRSHHENMANHGIYQCLLCTETFTKKYDWQRHEKSVHLPLERWICMPENTATTFCRETGQQHCAFCNEIEPSNQHMMDHDLEACIGRPQAQRTFLRKDHLRQHFRKVHNVSSIDELTIDCWKVGTHDVSSRCGFCDAQFETWNTRIDHIAAHFEAGARAKEWQGDLGFNRIKS